MRNIVLIAHDMRSVHNVGSLLRTAEGLGVSKVYLTGYTAHPRYDGDQRLPHIADKLDKQIDKTALGASQMIAWEYLEDVAEVIRRLHADKFTIAALEQTNNSISLPNYAAPDKIALLLGTEATGLPKDILALADCAVEIPMSGRKESFNVVQAAAMALYHCRFHA